VDFVDPFPAASTVVSWIFYFPEEMPNKAMEHNCEQRGFSIWASLHFEPFSCEPRAASGSQWLIFSFA
jgi:hypothetical protein